MPPARVPAFLFPLHTYLRCFVFLSLYHCHLDVFTERYPGTQGSLTTLLCWTLHYRISHDVDKIAFNQATNTRQGTQHTAGSVRWLSKTCCANKFGFWGHLKGERENQPPKVFLCFDLHMVNVARVPAPCANSKNF